MRRWVARSACGRRPTAACRTSSLGRRGCSMATRRTSRSGRRAADSPAAVQQNDFAPSLLLPGRGDYVFSPGPELALTPTPLSRSRREPSPADGGNPSRCSQREPLGRRGFLAEVGRAFRVWQTANQARAELRAGAVVGVLWLHGARRGVVAGRLIALRLYSKTTSPLPCCFREGAIMFSALSLNSPLPQPLCPVRDLSPLPLTAETLPVAHNGSPWGEGDFLRRWVARSACGRRPTAACRTSSLGRRGCSMATRRTSRSGRWAADSPAFEWPSPQPLSQKERGFSCGGGSRVPRVADGQQPRAELRAGAVVGVLWLHGARRGVVAGRLIALRLFNKTTSPLPCCFREGAIMFSALALYSPFSHSRCPVRDGNPLPLTAGTLPVAYNGSP